MRVLLGVTGGIAAYKAAEIVRRLRDAGHEVRCALTRSGARFLPALVLEVLSGRPVDQEEYLEGLGSGAEEHIAAAQWADVLVIAPATTHSIARLALGLGDDFLSTTALAFQGPLLVAPAMHSNMWERETTRQHVQALRSRGALIVGPVEGPLASGESGIGRMADPAVIVAAIDALATRRSWAGRQVVVTAGPTYEAIDPVRFLGNRSSGRMGFALAAEAARRGASVTLIAGPVRLETPAGVERRDVRTALEMQAVLAETAPRADLVIMAAAVADFRAGSVAPAKIKRGGSSGMTLALVPNPDLLAELATVAPSAIRVGFAAETDDLEANARKKLSAKNCDFLVANDVSRPDIGFDAVDNEVVVYDRSGSRRELTHRPKVRLAADLLDLFEPALAKGELAVVKRLGALDRATLGYLRDLGFEDLRRPEASPLRVVEVVSAPPEPLAPELRLARLEACSAEAQDCTACRLSSGRQKVVFGAGDPRARLLFIGEGPGAEEDKQGLPFVGRAGDLLTKIIEAISLRREDVYIANVVKCRPPGNRDPEPDEVAACRGFLERQIDLIEPRLLVVLGRVAAHTLLGSDTPISKMRGKWFEIRGLPAMVTFHPAALLRNPALKRSVWEDMQRVRDRLATFD